MAAASAGGEDDCPSSSSSASLSSSKNARLKFLCSFGGKILPRPSDGRLKYVGGDTRVLVVTRAVSFSELKERIQAMFRRCKVIKYQLVSEDLDILVTVAGDEDLAHMLDEYDRVDALHPRSPSAVSSPRFRLFLFPSPSSASDTAPAATLGQRYVDAINAVMPGSPPVFSISNVSSGANSPTSTTDCSGAFFASRPVALGGGGMHRVQSSPDLDGGRSLNPTGQHHQNLRHHHHLHHPAQHHHSSHRQPTPALQPHVAGGSGGWRPSPAPRHEASGCFLPRGGLHLRSAGEESHSGRASRSTSPFRNVAREPVIWE
ncbi:uncharacterized protein LOC141842024 [Curcuma longa]|uniref:uncharacterized protein LOC141842024 n=1 Tax=Curcuma longa TaxID=136217 RepID=UPI003D9E9E25